MPRAVLWVAVVAAGLTYALVALAGGAPPFPSRDECSRSVVEGEPIEAVFGRFDTEQDALELRDRAVALGFVQTEVEADACGRVEVVQHDIPSLEVGADFAEEVRSVGFEVTLQRDG